MREAYETHIGNAKTLFSPRHPTLVASRHQHSLRVHVDPTGVFHPISGAGSSSKIDYVRDMRSGLMSPEFWRPPREVESALALSCGRLHSCSSRRDLTA
jgi:hypothetical protein